MKISSNAQSQVRRLLESAPSGHAFLVEVLAGGCSGFKYKFSLGTPDGDAEVHDDEGSIVAVDSFSATMLVNAELDWDTSIISTGPFVRNTAATAKCGCGVSFAL